MTEKLSERILMGCSDIEGAMHKDWAEDAIALEVELARLRELVDGAVFLIQNGSAGNWLRETEWFSRRNEWMDKYNALPEHLRWAAEEQS